MAEEFSGLGSQLFIGNKDTGEVFSLNLQSNETTRLRKSYREEELDRIVATRPNDMIVPTDDGFQIMPTGFSFSGTCELPDSAEAEALRDMMRREMQEPLFDVHILSSLYRKCHGRAPRKILKAMSHGGYYRRDTKWKRKAVAFSNRYIEQSLFTICRARIEADEYGRVTICAGNRSGGKNEIVNSMTNVVRPHLLKSKTIQ